MEFNQQVFKAPAIPKIGKQTVASSVIRGAIKPQVKLKKTTFSFIKPIQKTVDTDKITVISEEGKKTSIIDRSLSFSNSILVAIKNQLDSDYTNRIASEKNELAKEKKRIAAKKVADKEARIEKGGKGILGKTFDKVVTPFKSIFQKLIDFFSIILTGILLNSAFKWLKDKNNQKKLSEFFNFLKEYWQELLIIFAAYKLARLVSKIVKIAEALKALISFFRRNPPKPPGGGSDPCFPLLQCMGNPVFSTSFVNSLLTNAAFAAGVGLIAQGLLPIPSPTPVPAFPLNLPTQPSTSPQPQARPVTPPSNQKSKNPLNPLNLTPKQQAAGWVSLAAGLAALGLVVATGATGGAATPATAPAFSALVPLLGFGSATSLGMGVGAATSKEEGKFVGGTVGYPKKKCTACSMGFSQGGTVGQGDRPGRDTVPAFVKGGKKIFLDPEEEVTRASEARRWRPLLKDVNNNGARLWAAFSQGVKDQTFANRDQLELNRNFGDVVKEFKDFVDSEIKKSKQKNRPRGSTPPPAPNLPPPQRPAQTSAGSSSTPAATAAPPPPSTSANPQQTNAILDNIWSRPAGTTAAMIAKQNGAMDPGGAPAQPQPQSLESTSGPGQQQLPVTPASTSDDLSKMGIEQLKKMLDPTKNARSVPGLFNHISGVREQNKNLSGSALERKVLEETVRFIRNANLQSVLPNREGLTRESNPQEGQTAFIKLPSSKIDGRKSEPSGMDQNSNLATGVLDLNSDQPHYGYWQFQYGVTERLA